jgi:CO dehydrogenase/acetyl-CoA synthase epsilon subunit
MTADMRAMIKQAVTALVTGGKPAAEIADAVVKGIREQRMHIITHPEILPVVEKRLQRILEAGK